MSKMSINHVRCLRRLCSSKQALVISIVFKGNIKPMHTSTRFSKQKKIFYNRYSKQLGLNQIYTGFGQEILEKQKSNADLDPESIDDQDFEEEILNEARKRRRAYKYRQMMKDFEKGPGPRYLTWDQMEHVRFLNQTSPEEWTAEMLSHSFQVPKVVIRKILRSKRVPSKAERQKLDQCARKTQNRPKFLTSAIETKHEKDERLDTKTLTVTDNNAIAESVDLWGLPVTGKSGWFSEYQIIEQNKNKDLEKKRYRNEKKTRDSERLEVEWLDDEETQFYLNLFLAYDEEINADTNLEEPEIDLKDDIDEQELLTDKAEVHRDGDMFYDRDGEFLYKI